MKKTLSIILVSGLLLAFTGCLVDRRDYSRRSNARHGYYGDRRSTTYYETRPTHRGDRRVYRDGDRYGRRDVRVYDAPRQSHGSVTVGF
jgi:hypothetical protein